MSLFPFLLHSRHNRGERSLRVCSAEAACVWLDPRCTITPHLEVEFPSSGCVLCVCESAPGQHHTDTLINHWSLFSVLVLDIAGRSSDSSSSRSTEIWRGKSLVLFECKVISISAADGWLSPACVCDVRVCSCCFCVGVSAFAGEGRGKRKKNRKRVRGERNAVCVWVAPEEWKKNIIQTKQQEMKFSSQGYIQVENECPCHLPRL